MTYKRDLVRQIIEYKKYFSVVALVGSRQAGKTTLLQKFFPDYKYYNLEKIETLKLVMEDPAGTLVNNPQGIIIDEIQRYPEMMSSIQAHVDETKKMGKVIISGSQNLLISEKISQSLAGRVAYCQLCTLSLNELKREKLLVKNAFLMAYSGCYPAKYERKIPPQLFYEQYISTYLERDVRQMRNIGDLLKFRKFMGLIAGRVGQLANFNSLANDVGVSNKTIDDWVSVLEASFIIYRLPPYFENVGKRLIKSPKLYFYDTGVLCYLLGLTNPEEVAQYYGRGSIFENLVIGEILKIKNNGQKRGDLYFYRDNHGNEVDLLIKTTKGVIPVEIKSSSSYDPEFLKGIKYWKKLSNSIVTGYVVYSGKNQDLTDNILLNWQDLDKIKNW